MTTSSRAGVSHEHQTAPKPAAAVPEASGLAAETELWPAGAASVYHETLADPRLPAVQRQALALRAGRQLGNRHVARALAPAIPLAVDVPQPAEAAPAVQRSAETAPRVQRGLWDTVTHAAASVAGAVSSAASAVADPRGAARTAIAGLARNLPGYSLLCLVLGRDPIAGQAVERNARTVVQAVLGLAPGGNLLFENLNASGALDRAFAWFEGQWAGLGLTWSAITGLFRQAWDSLSLSDFLNPAGVWERLKAIFLGPINRVRSFISNAAQQVMTFVFEGVLGQLGGGQVLALLRQAGGAFQTIIRDPIGFLRNLLSAVKLGLTNFVSNIGRHLQQGLMSWLLGAVAQTGLQLPQHFDLAGIFSLVMQVLGLTWQAIRGRAVRVLGERVVGALESTFEIFQIIRERGLAGLWEMLKERLAELKTTVLDGIKDLVITQVIQAGIRWLIGILGGPAGAVIQAIQMIYNVVMWFLNNASRLAALVQAVAGSLQAIAAGAVAAAAGRVEDALARTLPLAISFLARLIGLGDIGGKVRGIIEKIQAPINRAVDWIIGKARAAAARIGQGLRSLAGGHAASGAAAAPAEADERTPAQKQRDLDAALAQSERTMRGTDATPRQVEERLPAIKDQYRLKTLTLVRNDNGTYHVEGQVNPGGRSTDIPLSAADAEWERTWRAKQEEVQTTLAAFVPRFQELDPDAVVHIRGSLAAGVKLNPKKRVPAGQPHAGEPYVFNPTDFDIDAYVASDRLYAQALRGSGETDAALRGRIAGTRSGIPAVTAIIREMRQALGRVAGNRDVDETAWRFNVLIRSQRNARSTTRRDRAALAELGLPAARGEPLTVQPPEEEN